uniref:Uncharacterized protein n=1 Tax=Oryza brachyantha TaxID=4533 RepID=J3L0P3_ORYBR
MPPAVRAGQRVRPNPGERARAARCGAADEMLKHRNMKSVLFEGRHAGEQTKATHR